MFNNQLVRQVALLRKPVTTLLVVGILLTSFLALVVFKTSVKAQNVPVNHPLVATDAALQLSNLVVADTANAKAWSLQTNLQVGSVQYGDRGFTLATVPPALAGAAWVCSANSSKVFIGTPTVTFTTNIAATVYVAFDKRNVVPAWVDATWLNSGLTLTNNQVVGANTYLLYVKTFPAGAISLGPNDNGSSSVNMYTVIVTGTTTATPTPTTIPVATPTPTTVPVATPTPTTVPAATPTPTTIPVATPTPTTVPVATPTPTTVPGATPTPTTMPVATPTPTTVPVPTPTTTLTLQLSNLIVADTANVGAWSLQTNLQVGSVQYGDRGFTLATVPPALVGAAWVRSANSSKVFIGTPTVTFTTNIAATVYVAFDKRNVVPAWVDATWLNSGLTLTNNQVVGANTYLLYVKTFPAGAISLGPNDNGSSSVNMYTVIVTGATAATPTPTTIPAATPTPTTIPVPTPTPTALPGVSDWPQYLHDLGGSNLNSAETTLNSANIANLKVKWTATGTGGMSDQPVESNNVVYWGSWDGNLHATTVTGPTAGTDLWTTNLGVTTDSSCVPPQVGIGSTPALGMIGSTPVVFVGGGGNDTVGNGNDYVYALNATTGQIIWKTIVGSAPSDFAWSSPVLYNGSLYYGMASFGDCPLTRGRLIKLDQTAGAIQGTAYTVPVGCTGGGIWSTPTIDTATGMLYASTGTPSYCAGKPGDNSGSLVEINTATMAFVGNWQVPLSQQGQDADFGSAPTLFNGTINGSAKQLVGVANKNGIFYAFDRTNVTAGPVWQQTVANVGNCPQCGGGSISPAVWDGTTLYVAGGKITINGTNCKGSVNALDPSTGNFLWQHCLTDGPVLGSLIAISGVVVATEGPWVYALSMSNGTTLFSYHDTTSGAYYYGPATIANGYLFAGGIDGVFLAFSL